MLGAWETRAGGLPSLVGGANPSDIICILLVAIVGLCYQIFKSKEK